MFKRCAVLVLLVLLGVPALAVADGTGFYLAPKLLLSIQDTGKVDRSAAMAGSGVDDYSQFTVGGGLAVGMDFWQQYSIPIRLEAELALRGNSETTWTGDNGGTIKGVWNSSTLFANGYWDFRNDSPLVPYLGGGVGVALNYVGYDFKDFPESGTGNFSADDRFTNFAWNLGGGLAWNISDNLAADAAYRFVGLGYNEVKAEINNRKYEVSNTPYNNEFTVGVRLTF